MKAIIDVDVRDSVYEPGATDGTILYDRPAQNARYKVWLYLDGPDLSYVRSVTFTLHPTFPDPVRTVVRTPSNPTCALEIWTWGLFTVRVDIEDKSGEHHIVQHKLTYARDIKPNAQYRQVS